MTATRRSSIVLILLLVVGGIVTVGLCGAGCTSGTTPVCDDAGSCLIYSPSAGGEGGSPLNDAVAE